MRWIIDMYSSSIRSRSSGNRSARKLSGTANSKRAGAPYSYGPRIQPPRSSRTYHLASASRSTGCSGLVLRHSTSAGSGSVTMYWCSTGIAGILRPSSCAVRCAWLPVAVTTCSARISNSSSPGTRLPPFSTITRPFTIHSEPVH